MCQEETVEKPIITPSFLNALNQTNNVYDMIAICYERLLEHKKDNDMTFLSRAGNMQGDVAFGVCANYFNNFRESITNFVYLSSI